ncbi:flavodoxin domain-containing protein [Corynebacterium pilosum]|uniref:Flavodoxin domain n=1 Tax=Corynebacterium pilosum TaxID=35756 RepID=A0A376CNT6_9CORY|nr:flavodoxin domain-containing protein [Corynebacterium pilosum]STC70084.1 Flavodoxin domain [Corynebacterium pilosum]
MTVIFYSSTYGSTREYAEELARRVDANIQDIGDAPELGEGPVVVLSPVHGPSVPAVSFVKEHDFGDRPVAVAAVGMSLLEFARSKDQLKGALGSDYSHVERFYLPGRLNYSEISSAHKSVMFGVINALRMKPRKSENDKAMIAAYDKDVDRVDFVELDPIVEWVERSR